MRQFFFDGSNWIGSSGMLDKWLLEQLMCPQSHDTLVGLAGGTDIRCFIGQLWVE